LEGRGGLRAKIFGPQCTKRRGEREAVLIPALTPINKGAIDKVWGTLPAYTYTPVRGCVHRERRGVTIGPINAMVLLTKSKQQEEE